jgi:carbon-monoxide dehydrogenase medium subunit
MKPVDLDYYRPATLKAAVAALEPAARRTDVKVLAGCQTLGPMLNLRLARPGLLLDITRIAELQGFHEDAETVALGACITHAAIEDGRVPDPARGMMARVASGIAYRAVRNRGTIGGSVAHADPAADWLAALTVLDAEVEVAAHDGVRRVKLRAFVTGALATVLRYEEIIAAVCVPRLSPAARWGFHKIARKSGDFAEAIGTVVVDPERGVGCAVAGATGGAPIVIEPLPATAGVAAWKQRLAAGGYQGDDYDREIHAVALERAFEEAAGT